MVVNGAPPKKNSTKDLRKPKASASEDPSDAHHTHSSEPSRKGKTGKASAKKNPEMDDFTRHRKRVEKTHESHSRVKDEGGVYEESHNEENSTSSYLKVEEEETDNFLTDFKTRGTHASAEKKTSTDHVPSSSQAGEKRNRYKTEEKGKEAKAPHAPSSNINGSEEENYALPPIIGDRNRPISGKRHFTPQGGAGPAWLAWYNTHPWRQEMIGQYREEPRPSRTTFGL